MAKAKTKGANLRVPQSQAEANRDRLTNGGRTKKVQLTTGEIFWRLGTPAVAHRGLKVDDVVAAIRGRIEQVWAEAQAAKKKRNHGAAEAATAQYHALGLFLRVKTTIDKDAMQANRKLAESVPGVTFTNPGESFSVEPLASQIREVA